MKSRNVIVSLLFVVALLVFIFVKIRFWEPKREVSFKRNPSRIEYSRYAICRMECYNFNANTITSVLKLGEVGKKKKNVNCYDFTLNMLTKQGMHIFVRVRQCGTVTRVVDCFDANKRMPCNCVEDEIPPISFLKSKIDAQHV